MTGIKKKQEKKSKIKGGKSGKVKDELKGRKNSEEREG